MSLVADGERARTATVPAARRARFSGRLTYVEVGVLDAICVWGVGSALCMAALSVARVLRDAG